MVEIFDYLLYSPLREGYLDDNFLYLGGSCDAQLRHVTVLGEKNGEEAWAKYYG